MNRKHVNAAILTLAMLAVAALAGSPASADPTVLWPYGAGTPGGTPGYKYLIMPLVSEISGFEAPGLDTLLWVDGAAPFGGAGGQYGTCWWLWDQVATQWVGSDLFTRFHLDLCAGVTNVRVGVSIDNDLKLFVNGNEVLPVGGCAETLPEVFTGLCQTESCAVPDKVVYEVPDSYLVAGDNVFAIHARDREVVAFLDVQVTGDLSNQICTPPNDPPACEGAIADPAQLWPPNHKWNDIGIGGVTDPNGDELAVTITSIYQDEPIDAKGNGDGNTCPDGAGVGTSSASVRAERAGGADGRVYHIGFTATDSEGATCQGSVAVCVPHDQGQGNNCLDQGALFDSTVCP